MVMLRSFLDREQQRVLENVCAAATRIWSGQLHRYYTNHGVDHSDRIIKLLDSLTDELMCGDKCLSSTEVLVLLASAYLHDIGMQDERFAGGDLEAIRAAHDDITEEMIYRSIEEPDRAISVGLPNDPGLVRAVAKVAKGHRRVNLAGPDYDPQVHGDETLRLRLLTALLRFGDELDIDHRRVDLQRMRIMTPPVESQWHWWRCHYVSGVTIHSGWIQINFRLPTGRADYEDLVVPLVDSVVRAKLATLKKVLWDSGVKIDLGDAVVVLMPLLKPLSDEVEALAWQKRKEMIIVDPNTPPEIRHLIGEFEASHKQLKEWKELHNLYNTLTMRSAHLVGKVEMMEQDCQLGKPVDVESYQRSFWKPIKDAIHELLQFAANVESIGIAFSISRSGELIGDRWAVDPYTKGRAIDELLTSSANLDLTRLRLLTGDWIDLVDAHMFFVDTELKKTADALYDLSQKVAWRVDR